MRLSSITLVFLACLVLAVPSLTAQSFSDVSPASDYATEIEDLRSRRIVSGYDEGTFRPTALVNRAEFTKMMVLARVTEADITDLLARVRMVSFGDVPSTAWYWRYVMYARASGIVAGYPDGFFRPEQTVNSAEAAKITAETFDLPIPAIRCVRACEWWLGYMEALNAKGILPASAGQPEHALTRAEMSAIISRVLRRANTSSAADRQCVRAGCSSQLCVDASVADEMVTTCEWRETYACYQSAACEVQASGECGWTPTTSLNACLNQR